MDQRIRPSLSVDRRTSDTLETDALVEANGFRVLFVHVSRQVRVFGKRRMDKRFADAFAMVVRVDKKGFQMPVMQKHETQGGVSVIDGKQETHLRKEGRNLAFNRDSVVRVEKIMRGIDGPSPNIYDAGDILID